MEQATGEQQRISYLTAGMCRIVISWLCLGLPHIMTCSSLLTLLLIVWASFSAAKSSMHQHPAFTCLQMVPMCRWHEKALQLQAQLHVAACHRVGKQPDQWPYQHITNQVCI